jgi:hypothetical protein
MTEPGSTSGTDRPSVVASAVYVAGNSSLEPGRRYDIAVRGYHLQILAPAEDGPPALLVDRPIAECQSSVVEGRLIVSEPHVRSGLVLAFMSIAGATPDALAAAIRDAARASARQ